MKPYLSLLAAFTLLLLLAGCAAGETAPDGADSSAPQDTVDAALPPEDPAPVPLGTTEPFTRGALHLEVSNVQEIRTESKLSEGIEPYEVTVFTCYPGAVLTVLNADMSDPLYSEDHKAYPQWGLYDSETDTRVRLSDGVEPIPLDESTDGVFNLEASLFVLRFEFAEE